MRRERRPRPAPKHDDVVVRITTRFGKFKNRNQPRSSEDGENIPADPNPQPKPLNGGAEATIE